jgi:thiamine biosynthesis lipoprotein
MNLPKGSKAAQCYACSALCLAWLTACDTAAPTPKAKPAASASATPAFQPQRIEFSGSAMGTSITVIGYTTPKLDPTAIQRAIDDAMHEVQRLERLMSSWREDSEVSKLNEAKGEFVSVSPETLEVIQKGLWAGSISEGTFDITFQALSGLWKFGDARDDKPEPPSRSEVMRIKPLVDYRRIQIDAKARKVKLGLEQRVGLGGVAKGYIVDKAAKVLRDAGLAAFLLRAGGDLYGAGRKPDGQPWVAGIQDPRGQPNDYFATLELTDRAFSTAGDYARAYVHQGKRYHHIIDPRTGYPATRCRSVTVWAKTALLADVVDDSVFILGPENGLKLVESLDGVGAVIVDADNKVFVSKRLQGEVELLHDPNSGD